MSIPAKFTVALLPGFLGLFVASILGYQSYLAENEVIALKSSPSTSQVLGDTDEILTFRVNAPTRFTNTVRFDLGLNLGDSEINTQGNASFGSVSAETVTANNLLYSLSVTDGLELDDTDPQNPSLKNTGILTLVAGDYIKVEGNKISSTYTFTPDYTQGGWTRTGTVLKPSVLSDSVEVGALTASSLVVNGITVLDGNVTVGNGVSILPNTDLGSDLGSSTYRFNNLWVANINSNSSQSFAGQTTFSYPPQDDTISQASVLINPTTSAANGQLLGLGIAGYQRAMIDSSGNLTLGYSDSTSAPTSSYPLNIYGHSGTRVSFTDTTGNAYFAGNVGIGTTSPTSPLHIMTSSDSLKLQTADNSWMYFDWLNSSGTRLAWMGLNDDLTRFQIHTQGITDYITFTGANVGIGTTSPTANLHIVGRTSTSELHVSNGNAIYTNTGSVSIGATNAGTAKLYVNGNVGIGTTNPTSALQVDGIVKINPEGTTNRWIIDGSYLGANDSYAPTMRWRTSTTTIPNIIPRKGDDDTGIGGGDSNLLSLIAGGVNGLNVNGSGNVGIGTTSPDAKLTLHGSLKLRHPSQPGWAGWDIEQDSSANMRIGYPTNAPNALYIKFDTGNIGIGTTAPDSRLHVDGSNIVSSSSNMVLKVTKNAGDNAFAVASNGIVWAGTGGLYVENRSITKGYYNSRLDFGITDLITNTADANPSLYGGLKVFGHTGTTTTPEVFRITATGNVGIGTTAPTNKLSLAITASDDGFYLKKEGSLNNLFRLSMDGTNDRGELFVYNGSNPMFAVRGPANMSFINSGNFGIGTTAPGEKLEVAGNIKTSSLTTGTVYSNAGVLTNTDPSDINLKDNVLDLSEGTLQRLMDLRAVSFNWKSTGDGALGFIAQEVRDIFPELVGTNSDGSLGLYTTQFIPILTRAIQQQQLEIDELKLSSQSATIAYATSEDLSLLQSLINTMQEAITNILLQLDSILTRLAKVEEKLDEPKEELCIGDPENPTCITAEELELLLQTLPLASPEPSVEGGSPTPQSEAEILSGAEGESTASATP